MEPCKFCNKLLKNRNALLQHEVRCKENPTKIPSSFEKYNISIKNGAVTKVNTNQFTKAKLKGESICVSNDTRNKLSKTSSRPMSQSQKDLLKSVMKEVAKNNPSSYSAANINGRVKKIKYGEVLLDGSWEVEFAKWCDLNQINWRKNSIGFKYQYLSETRTYYPDFFLFDFNMYVEVKGYIRERDLSKWKALSNLIVVDYSILTKIKKNTLSLDELLKLTRIPSHS